MDLKLARLTNIAIGRRENMSTTEDCPHCRWQFEIAWQRADRKIRSSTCFFGDGAPRVSIGTVNIAAAIVHCRRLTPRIGRH